MTSSFSRRGFLAGGAGLAGSALLPSGLAVPGAAAAAAAPAGAAVDKQLVGGLFPPERIGIQLYSLSDQISSIGMAKTLEEVARIGFKQLEFAGYGDGNLPEIRKVMDANGLTAIGSHVEPNSDDSMKQIISDAQVLGIPNVGISLPLPTQGGPTKIGWTALAKQYNHYGEMAAKEGIGFYLHNHFHEWIPCVDAPNLRGEDVLLMETDPRYVFFEMDIYWAHVGQGQSVLTPFDPLQDYALKHKDRYKLFHVKDGKPDATGGFAIPLTNICDVGQGKIDFQTFFDTLFASAPGEVDKHHYVWERDNATEHPRGSLAAARSSFTYMRYGLTGPNAPAVENLVPGAVTSLSVKRSKTGRPAVRVGLRADEQVEVAVRVVRNGKALSTRAVKAMGAGLRSVELKLPALKQGGTVTVEVTFTRATGAPHKVRLPVVVPARR